MLCLGGETCIVRLQVSPPKIDYQLMHMRSHNGLLPYSWPLGAGARQKTDG